MENKTLSIYTFNSFTPVKLRRSNRRPGKVIQESETGMKFLILPKYTPYPKEIWSQTLNPNPAQYIPRCHFIWFDSFYGKYLFTGIFWSRKLLIKGSHVTSHTFKDTKQNNL